jgi:DUF971 family protein
MPPTTPARISANRQTNELTITWSDNHSSVFSFVLLRNACPCAECRGGHENMHPEPDPNVFFLPMKDERKTSLRSVKTVGNYALTITWEDGHSAGIYSWDYLLALEAGQEKAQHEP